MRTYPTGLLVVLLAAPLLAGADIDLYGGDTRLQAPNPSGFFRVAKIDERYWLITPEGNAFWGIGPTTVQYNDSWGQDSLGLDYNANLLGFLARYPTGQPGWLTRLHERWAAWSQNNEGGFSQDISGTGGRKITECFRVYFFTSRHQARGGKMVAGGAFPDVFDEPKFTNAVNEFASTIAAYKNDPYRIGAFPDNEIDWSYRGKHLAAAFIEAASTTPGKRHMVDTWLHGRYGGDLAALNAAWGTGYSSWSGPEGTSLINAVALPADNAAYPAIRADKVAWTRVVAEKYFSTVSGVVRANDPNHLIFSNRIGLFTGTTEPQYDDYNTQLWEAIGDHCDIVAINSYVDAANFEAAYGYFGKVFRAAGKPIMITEWARHANDTLISHSGWALPNQSRRAERAIQIAREFWSLRSPTDPNDGSPAQYLMGMHWFQHYDEPSLGRPDGENANWGYLNVMDEAYLTFLEPMRDLWAQKYDILIDEAPYRAPARPTPLAPYAGQLLHSASARFSWSPVPDAATYDLLVSQDFSFVEDQCLAFRDIAATAYTIPPELAAGVWYWCVRAKSGDGLGGLYCDPACFNVEADAVDPAEAFSFEDPLGWRSHGRGDSGGGGSALARADRALVAGGTASLRLDFAGFSKNLFPNKANFGPIEASKLPPDGSLAGPAAAAEEVQSGTGPLTGYPLAFADDFTTGNAGAWLLPTGSWSVSDGAYRQTDTGSWGLRSSIPARLGDAEYVVDVRILSAVDPPNWAGLMINREDVLDTYTGSGYLIGIRQHGGVFIWNTIDKVIYDDPAVIADTGAWNRLHVVMQGASMAVYINDQLWRSWTDPNARWADGGYTALITGRVAAAFDNVQVFTRDWDPSVVQFVGQDLAVAWAGGELDYGPATALEFDLFPFRMALQDASIKPSSRYLRVRMLDVVGGVVLDHDVDPAGQLPAATWSHVSIPLGAAPRANVHRLEFLMNNGDYRFPLDQRIRLHVDNLTPPAAVRRAPPPAGRIVVSDEFDRAHLEQWIPTGGEWGLWAGALHGFGVRQAPDLLLCSRAVIRHGTLAATLRAKSSHSQQRAWIVFAVDQPAGAFSFAGLDAAAGQWELDRYNGSTFTVWSKKSESIVSDRDYALELVLSKTGAKLHVNGELKLQRSDANLPEAPYGVGQLYSHVVVERFSAQPLAASMLETR